LDLRGSTSKGRGKIRGDGKKKRKGRGKEGSEGKRRKGGEKKGMNGKETGVEGKGKDFYSAHPKNLGLLAPMRVIDFVS